MSDPETKLLEVQGARFNFIPFDTLSNRRFPFKNLPVVNGIVIKTEFVPNEATGRMFPQKTYFYFEKNLDLESNEKITKRNATELLLDPLVNYLKDQQLRPKRVEFIEKSKTKVGNVKYEIKFSQYDSFNFTFTPEIFDTEDVSLYINNIPLDPEDLDKPTEGETPWKVEYAKSSRAKCRTCSEKIEKGDLRIGEPSFYDGHVSYRWHHKHCILDLKGKLIDGIENLDEKEKTVILNLQGEKSDVTESEQSPQELLITIIRKFAGADGLTTKADVYRFGKEQNLTTQQIDEELQKLEDNGIIYSPSPGTVRYFD